MRKRLIKVFESQLTGEKRALLPEQIPLNIVLKSGHTLFGKLQSQSLEKIKITDKRFHQHTLDIKDIDVVVYDYPSSY